MSVMGSLSLEAFADSKAVQPGWCETTVPLSSPTKRGKNHANSDLLGIWGR